jgi:heme/copper-type cytochrome/quinol oxidase subunit 2
MTNNFLKIILIIILVFVILYVASKYSNFPTTINFQIIVIVIAIIILIIMLTYIGRSLSKYKYSGKWPPITGLCPDYWIDLSGNGEQCYNEKKLGICNIATSEDDKNTMNFNIPPYNNFDNSTCAKYQWAKDCKVSWDGITSGIENPCKIKK